MAITFNKTPVPKPTANNDTLNLDNFEEGFYRGEIKAASMKKPKPKMVDGKPVQNPDYLNVQIQLYKEDGKKYLTVFDMFSEPVDPAGMFKLWKLQTFTLACGIELEGSFELKDLCKILPDKELMIDVIVEPAGDYPAKLKVNINSDEPYLPVNGDKVPPKTPTTTEELFPELEEVPDSALPFSEEDLEEVDEAEIEGL